jgi:hypothetical protein
MPRADNLAAFGVGRAIAEEIQKLDCWKNDGIPTSDQVKTIIKRLFSDKDALATAVNEFHRYLDGKPEIQTDALFFSPRYGGFNINSLKENKKLETYKGLGSIEYFTKDISGAYRKYSKVAADDLTPLELDEWLRYHRENYTHPKGYTSDEKSIYLVK